MTAQEPAKVRGLRRRHPEHLMAPAGEEHRDQHPRRPGRLEDHRQARALRSSRQRGLLNSQQRSRFRDAGRPADQPPIWLQTRTACRDAIPRSIPTSRLRSGWLSCTSISTSLLSPELPDSGGTAGAATLTGHGPRAQEPSNSSHSCAATGPDPSPGWPTSLMQVIRGQASSGNQIRETRCKPASEPTRRHLPDQPGMLMQPWNPRADQAPELPYMNPRPLRPELAALLGVWPSSQLTECAAGRCWRLRGDVAVLLCCTAYRISSSVAAVRIGSTWTAVLNRSLGDGAARW